MNEQTKDTNPAVAQSRLHVGLAAKYPLEIMNVGEDTYILMSKGHHDPHEFMRVVREEGYEWPLGMPEHEWTKTVPAPKNSGYTCMYISAKQGDRGAFPTTYVREAYGEDRYEALTAANATAQGREPTGEASPGATGYTATRP